MHRIPYTVPEPISIKGTKIPPYTDDVVTVFCLLRSLFRLAYKIKKGLYKR